MNGKGIIMENSENIGKLELCYAVPNLTGMPIGLAVVFTQEEVDKYDEGHRLAAVQELLKTA